MSKFLNFSEFLHYLFDDVKQAEKAAQVVQTLLESQSPLH